MASQYERIIFFNCSNEYGSSILNLLMISSESTRPSPSSPNSESADVPVTTQIFFNVVSDIPTFPLSTSARKRGLTFSFSANASRVIFWFLRMARNLFPNTSFISGFDNCVHQYLPSFFQDSLCAGGIILFIVQSTARDMRHR